MFKVDGCEWTQVELSSGKVGFVLANNKANDRIKGSLSALSNHFNNGGGVNSPVLAGVMRVTTTTVDEWQNQSSKYFNPYFCAIIDFYSAVGAEKVMAAYMAHAMGNDTKNSGVNIKLLERVAIQYIPAVLKASDLTDTNTTTDYRSPEELTAQIKAMSAELL